MEKRPHALLLKFPGTNCDRETARALETVGFSTTTLPTARLTRESFDGVDLVMFSGGFSYGDYVMAGRLAQLRLEESVGDMLKEFVEGGGYALGVCNGFQILTKVGLLPEGSLIDNTSRRFQCLWSGLKQNGEGSPYLTELPTSFELPIAHAEGRFVAPEGKAESYVADGLATLLYETDVNGSSAGIAGLQDVTGRVFGLMPHPERFLYKRHHYDPDWDGDAQWGWGYYFFKGIHDRIQKDKAA